MYAAERHQVLVRRARELGRLEVTQVAAELGVTTETIRRDLTVLERQGLLRRVHGGAIAADRLELRARASRDRDVDARRREGPHRQGRARPSSRPPTTILLDAGTTTARLATLLPDDASSPSSPTPSRSPPRWPPAPDITRPPRRRARPRHDAGRGRPLGLQDPRRASTSTSRSSAPTASPSSAGSPPPTSPSPRSRRAMVGRRPPHRRAGRPSKYGVDRFSRFAAAGRRRHPGHRRRPARDHAEARGRPARRRPRGGARCDDRHGHPEPEHRPHRRGPGARPRRGPARHRPPASTRAARASTSPGSWPRAGRPTVARDARRRGRAGRRCCAAPASPVVASRSPGRPAVNTTLVEPDGTTTKVNEPGPGAHRRARLDALVDAGRRSSPRRPTGWSPPGGLPAGCRDDFHAPHRPRRPRGRAPGSRSTPPATPLRPAVGRAPRPGQAERRRARRARRAPAAGARRRRSPPPAELCSGGIDTVLVSMGAAGAVVVDRDESWHVASPAVAVRSTVGAGDSTLAGYLIALGAGAERRTPSSTRWPAGPPRSACPAPRCPGPPTSIPPSSVRPPPRTPPSTSPERQHERPDHGGPRRPGPAGRRPTDRRPFARRAARPGRPRHRPRAVPRRRRGPRGPDADGPRRRDRDPALPLHGRHRADPGLRPQHRRRRLRRRGRPPRRPRLPHRRARRAAAPTT